MRATAHRLRKIGIVLLAWLAATASLSAQSDTINIKSHSRAGKNPPGELALLHAELDGQAVILQCVLSHNFCKELPPGQYNIERLLEGEGSYPNCANVDIYRLGADSSQEEPLGEYCMHEQKHAPKPHATTSG